MVFISTITAALCLSIFPVQMNAQGTIFTTESEWTLGVSGVLPVFLVASGHKGYSSDGNDQFATRVMSGFNPAGITFTVTAPVSGGLTVTGVFQINHHLQGAGIQNDGLFEGRVAEMQVSGSFGTVSIGKGFGIFNSISIGDAGSGMGVGRFGGPESANATLGRIGSGYTYANFNPRVMYTSPDLGGLTLKAGLFNPEKPGGLTDRSTGMETAMPRLEAQADYLIGFDAGTVRIWVGGLYQNVDVISFDYDYTMSGFDSGLRLIASGFTLTGAYSQTTGIGADGLIGLNLNGSGLDQAEVEATQWYGEITYDFGSILIGTSYGEGSQNAAVTPVGSSPDITNKLLMAFARYRITGNLTLLGEFQTFRSEAQANYAAVIAGMQFGF